MNLALISKGSPIISLVGMKLERLICNFKN